MKVAILSDIHGNLAAIQSVVSVIQENDISAIILLGDIIDYGPHSNEVIKLINSIDVPIICSIYGNHEKAIMDDCYDFFSSKRGKESAQYTKNILSEQSLCYIANEMDPRGKKSFELDGRMCLAIHGSEEEVYWKAINRQSDLSDYRAYDWVFSGHSHLPHYFMEFYPDENEKMRNKKKTIFINPGSVGQPRNHNPAAQFAVFDTETEEVQMKCVTYDIKGEIGAFSDNIDIFYRERLEIGV